MARYWCMCSVVLPACLSITLLGVALHDPPAITSLWMSASQVHPGEIIQGRVTATKNTASVEARIGGYGITLRKIDSFTFVGSYRVPRVPFFLRRSWTVRFIARNVDGVTAEQDAAISVR